MANQKRKRQKAARQAKVTSSDNGAASPDGAELPDIPDAVPEQAAEPARPVEVVSTIPGRGSKALDDSAAAEARRQAVRDVRLRRQRNLAFRRFAIIMGAIIAAFIGIGFLLSGGDDDEAHLTQENVNYLTFLPSDYGTGACAVDGGGETSPTDAPRLCITQGEPLEARFDTSLGQVTVALNTTETVGTANNFVNLARSGFYDGLEVFRTDPLTDTVYSGAATNEDDDPGPGYTIPDEATGFVYGPGLLAMSRTELPDSAGSAYFFTVGDEASNLDAQGTFVVFGEVTAGLDALRAILELHQSSTDSLTGSGRPGETVTINSVTIQAPGEA